MTLVEAKKRANLFRFSGELAKNETNELSSRDSVKDFLLLSALEIKADIAPGLEEILSDVCLNLSLERSHVSAFVANDPNYQAAWHPGTGDECIISVSSGLVSALNNFELAFVLGHEIGHYLLDHSGLTANDLAPESFMQNRAQEISADRIGFLAAGKIEYGIGTFIKTLSGLGNEHLRINVANFISQANKIKAPSTVQNGKSTHPPILIRSRALIHFQSALSEKDSTEESNREAVLKSDKRINLDLERFIDAPIHKQEAQIKKDLLLSLAVNYLVSRPKVSEKSLKLFANLFGENNYASFQRFLNSFENNDRQRISQENLERDRAKLETLFPRKFDLTYKKMQKKIFDFFE